MQSKSKTAVRLALKILSPQYRKALGEVITEADLHEIRQWAGDLGAELSAQEAASLIILRALAGEQAATIQ